MIKDISEFKSKYKLQCEPARSLMVDSIKRYNQALSQFIEQNICIDDPFDEVYSQSYINCLEIYGCGSDNLTDEMIFEYIISEFKCHLLGE